MVKVVTRICNILSVLMVLAVVAVGAAMIVPKIMGNDIYAVMSGSMEPYYHVGSVVIALGDRGGMSGNALWGDLLSLAAAVFVCMQVKALKKLHPIVFIAAAAVIGAVFQF